MTPGALENLQKGGGRRPPPFWRVSKAPRGHPDPENDRFPILNKFEIPSQSAAAYVLLGYLPTDGPPAFQPLQPGIARERSRLRRTGSRLLPGRFRQGPANNPNLPSLRIGDQNLYIFVFGFWPDSGRTWPRDPLQRVGLEKWCRTHPRSAPETNSKAVSRPFSGPDAPCGP